MTIKTLSVIAVRVTGWLIVLKGIGTFLYMVLLGVIQEYVMAANGVAHGAPGMSFLPIGAVITGVFELAVGFIIIHNSEAFGPILSKGLDERI